MRRLYQEHFYRLHEASVEASSTVIVPLLIERFHPTSVVDVGCGLGGWIKTFATSGVEDLLGVDGPWVDPKLLVVDSSKFLQADLSSPPELGRKFSMAVCLEVAEHLPPSVGPKLVEYLTRLSPVVVFSGAIPGQGGVGHVNERWQSYWAGVFRDQGYLGDDFLRKLLWDNPDIAWWYSQNIVVYIDEAHAKDIGYQRRDFEAPWNVVHPRMLKEALKPENIPIQLSLGALGHAARRKVRPLMAFFKAGRAKGS